MSPSFGGEVGVMLEDGEVTDGNEDGALDIVATANGVATKGVGGADASGAAPPQELRTIVVASIAADRNVMTAIGSG